jgi:hypothetical protein
MRRYTRSFGGTSGAGPIVTNAVVAVQSYLKATGRAPYTSAQMIELLRRTGTPQTGTRLVGPLPNLAAALRDIEVDGPVTAASFSPVGVNGWYLSPTVTISADDGWGVGVKDGSIEYRLDGGDWKPYTGPFQATAPNAHTLDMRAADIKGNTATHSTTFNVYDLDTPVDGSANAAVPATLSLTLGAPASFGAFTPGVDKSHAATTSANVISTAGDATLRVADPSANARGRLVNGRSRSLIRSKQRPAAGRSLRSAPGCRCSPTPVRSATTRSRSASASTSPPARRSASAATARR